MTNFDFITSDARVAQDGAINFAEAICEMLEARMALTRAQDNVPQYTGPNSTKSYYQNELEIYYRACDRLWDIVKENK